VTAIAARRRIRAGGALKDQLNLPWSTPRDQVPKPPSNPFTVRVSDNWDHDDPGYAQGSYPTLEEAIAACRGIVHESLTGIFKPGMSAETLLSRWCSGGQGAGIVGAPGQPFSAWRYAKERCAQIAAAPAAK
jgi:hypothetical protein